MADACRAICTICNGESDGCECQDNDTIRLLEVLGVLNSGSAEIGRLVHAYHLQSEALFLPSGPSSDGAMQQPVCQNNETAILTDGEKNTLPDISVFGVTPFEVLMNEYYGEPNPEFYGYNSNAPVDDEWESSKDISKSSGEKLPAEECNQTDSQSFYYSGVEHFEHSDEIYKSPEATLTDEESSQGEIEQTGQEEFDQCYDGGNGKRMCPFTFCSTIFKEYLRGLIPNHLRSVHEGKDMFSWTKSNCGKFYYSKEGRGAHEQEHAKSGEEEVCPRCGPIGGSLRAHVYVKHRFQRRTFKCYNHLEVVYYVTEEESEKHIEEC